jgi:hypothetical protein
MYIQIPESVVRESAEACKDDDRNSFLKILKAADEFRAAEMTPIFLLDQIFKDLVVVALETYQKKLH